jgi:hypothetical protein
MQWQWTLTTSSLDFTENEHLSDTKTILAAAAATTTTTAVVASSSF